MTLLNEGTWTDFAIVFYISKKFITPFKKWKAYSLGLIDEKGRRTKKPIKTSEEKNAYTLLDRFVRKIRVFIGDKWFLKLTLAYLLLKEDNYFPDSKLLLTEQQDYDNMKKILLSNEEYITIGFSDNISSYSFFISSHLKDSEGRDIITSIFGNDNISKTNNEDLKRTLDSIFLNLLEGGYREFYIYDANFNPVKVSINYSPSEFKIESSATEGELILGKFFSIFPTVDSARKLIIAWRELR